MSSGRKEYLRIGKQLKRSSRGIGRRPPEMLYILSAVAHFLPEKLTVYTTPVGLLNARNYNFGGECQLRPGSRQLKETLFWEVQKELEQARDELEKQKHKDSRDGGDMETGTGRMRGVSWGDQMEASAGGGGGGGLGGTEEPLPGYLPALDP